MVKSWSHRNYVGKSKNWWKNESLIGQNPNDGQKSKFSKKFKFRLKIAIFGEYQNSSQKPKLG